MTNLLNNFIEHSSQNDIFLLAAELRQDGEVVGEWNKFAAKPRFESYSTAKSFAAVGAGIAVDEGLITLDEPVSASFPEATYDIASENALGITVRDLLTMTSGVSNTMFWRDGYERKHERDWIRFFYKNGKFDYKPGTVFQYNNVNSYILGCLIEKKSGRNLREYLRYRLFEPLEIHNVEWTSCPLGHTVVANSMAISVDELGRFGQLLANGGKHKGKRLVSESFVKDMLTAQIETNEYLPGEPQTKAGYGYQIWLDGKNNAAYLWGIFGQYCIILPEKNAVISIQALQQNDGGSNGNYSKISALRQMIWEDLVTRI